MTSTHSHMWHLPDGTGLHAAYGVLTVESGTGRLCCHLCGQWFRSLSSHVRTHGHTAESYRAELALCRSQPLTAHDLSAAIARRQQVAYHSREYVRDRLVPGQRMARDGSLADLAARARREKPPAAAQAERQLRTLAAGRETSAARRQAALDERLTELGATHLSSYLRERYAEGASLEQLAVETGLGRTRLRSAVTSGGITLRKRGVNTVAGRRSRAVAAETAAALLLGTDNLRTWLRDRRAEGWTLTRLGAAVGHSSHWVRWRLDDAGPGLATKTEDSSQTG